MEQQSAAIDDGPFAAYPLWCSMCKKAGHRRLECPARPPYAPPRTDLFPPGTPRRPTTSNRRGQR